MHQTEPKNKLNALKTVLELNSMRAKKIVYEKFEACNTFQIQFTTELEYTEKRI